MTIKTRYSAKYTYTRALQLAKENGACNTELSTLNSYNSWEDIRALKPERQWKYACWFLRNVIASAALIYQYEIEDSAIDDAFETKLNKAYAPYIKKLDAKRAPIRAQMDKIRDRLTTQRDKRTDKLRLRMLKIFYKTYCEPTATEPLTHGGIIHAVPDSPDGTGI